jgi:hypothetical protein
METLLSVGDERAAFLLMRQRFDLRDGQDGEQIAYRDSIAEPVLARLESIEAEVQSLKFDPQVSLKSQLEVLESLSDQAVEQGEQRAYLCPVNEIADEGRLLVDSMEEWNLPENIVSRLRDLLVDKLRDANQEPQRARSSLRNILDEKDSWAGYTDNYEVKMKRFAVALLLIALAASAFACLLFHWCYFIIIGLVLAGLAGSCFSVLYKMPTLEVILSGELDSFARRVICRLAIGVAASVLGCGLVALNLIPLGSVRVEFLNALCRLPSDASFLDYGKATLILLSIPMGFGFLERPLSWFQEKLLGS